MKQEENEQRERGEDWQFGGIRLSEDIREMG